MQPRESVSSRVRPQFGDLSDEAVPSISALTSARPRATFELTTPFLRTRAARLHAYLGIRRRTRQLLLLLAGAVLAACDDGPTGPGVYSHPAGGQVWVAVRAPESTSSVRTWLPYVRVDREDRDSVLQSIRMLSLQAERSRRAGDLAGAQSRETEAELLAARSLAHAPAPHVLAAALGALQVWVERASSPSETDDIGELADAISEVRSRRGAAVALLHSGDTTAAVVEIASASAVVRSLAPDAVATRALVSAERRLAARPVGGSDADRAVRLLRHARVALSQGDQVRAFRRALYALQLVERFESSPTSSDSARH